LYLPALAVFNGEEQVEGPNKLKVQKAVCIFFSQFSIALLYSPLEKKLNRKIMQCNNNNNKIKKTVQWASSCSLRLFKMPYEQQQFDAWYQPNDYKSFKENCKIISRLARERGTESIENQMNDSCRGLEHLVTPRLAAIRCCRRNIVWDVVLDEQYYESAPETIAKKYSEVSALSQEDAQQQALRYRSENDAPAEEEAKMMSTERRPIANSLKKLTRQLSHRRLAPLTLSFRL
jgi:hypothetical protein